MLYAVIVISLILHLSDIIHVLFENIFPILQSSMRKNKMECFFFERQGASIADGAKFSSYILHYLSPIIIAFDRIIQRKFNRNIKDHMFLNYERYALGIVIS